MENRGKHPVAQNSYYGAVAKGYDELNAAEEIKIRKARQGNSRGDRMAKKKNAWFGLFKVPMNISPNRPLQCGAAERRRLGKVIIHGHKGSIF